MIKINLLPPNIFEARAVKRLMVVFGVIALVIIVACAAWTMKISSDTRAMAAQADDVQRLSEQAAGIRAQADGERARIAPMDQKRQFFEAVWDYNSKYPDLYEDLAKFTYAKVTYSQLTPSSGTLQLQAVAPTLSDAGRYLLNLYRATHIFSSVSISAVPGYPPQAGAGGGGLMMPSGAPTPLAVPGGGSMPLPMAPPVSEGGPATSYGGLAAISAGVSRAEAQRPGFSFTVTCALANPIFPPSFGGAAAQGQGMPGMPAMPGLAAPLPVPGGAPVPATPAAAPARAATATPAGTEVQARR